MRQVKSENEQLFSCLGEELEASFFKKIIRAAGLGV